MKQFIFKAALLIILISSSLFIGSQYYYYSPFYHRITYATAVIHPTKGNTASGIITFLQGKNGILIKGQISGLTPGEHGFHIHQWGDCACDDAACAGDHFNPTGQPHAGPTAPHRHSGDLGNIVADEQGNAVYERIDIQIQLNGPHSIIGRSLIIHAKKDDLISQPTGDAGARRGCGVIGLARSA